MNLHKHYFKSSRLYEDLSAQGAESHLAYYKRMHPKKYDTLLISGIEVVDADVIDNGLDYYLVGCWKCGADNPTNVGFCQICLTCL